MTPSATEKNEKKTPSVFYTLSNLSLSLSHRCIPSISSSRFSCSFPSASACLIAWVEAAEESPVPFPSPPPPPPPPPPLSPTPPFARSNSALIVAASSARGELSPLLPPGALVATRRKSRYRWSASERSKKCLRSRGRGPGRGGRGGIGGEGELSTEFTSLAQRSPSLSLSTLPVLTPHELQDIKEKLPVPALDLIIRLSLFKRASRETPSKVSTTSTL